MKISQVLILVLAICFLSATALSAQGLTAKGLKGGISLARFTGSDASIGSVDPSMAVKFAVGGFLNFEVSEQVSIRPEVYYSSKGSHYEEGDAELTFTMNYIDIPVLVVIKAGDNFGIFAGPQLGIYLNGEMSNSGSADIESDDVTSPEFELVFGANYFINQFHIDARYALGISKTFDVSSDDDDVRHGVIQILLGIAL